MHKLESVCSTCLRPVEAQAIELDGARYLLKTCPEHGQEQVLESSSTELFFDAPLSAEARAALRRSGSALVSPLGPTCVALLEITDGCNLECPVCFAASRPGNRYFMKPAEFSQRLACLIAERGKIDILMLSGGEPTIHPEFPEILAIAVNNPNIGHVMLNTNGLLVSRSERVQQALRAAWAKLEVYLQFDSLEESRNIELRGVADLLADKMAALNWFASQGFAVTFAVTLPADTRSSHLGEILDLALATPSVRGITFQPAFASGRHQPRFDPNERLTVPDVVRLINEARPEKFPKSAFVNLPCSHPNCSIVAYFFRHQGQVWPLAGDMVPLQSIRRRINYNLEDLKACGCENTELGQYVRSAELSADNSFRVVIKPFMDRFNLNRDRTAQCCTHVIGPGGERMSFCEYNVFRDQMGWNVNTRD